MGAGEDAEGAGRAQEQPPGLSGWSPTQKPSHMTNANVATHTMGQHSVYNHVFRFKSKLPFLLAPSLLLFSCPWPEGGVVTSFPSCLAGPTVPLGIVPHSLLPKKSAGLHTQGLFSTQRSPSGGDPDSRSHRSLGKWCSRQRRCSLWPAWPPRRAHCWASNLQRGRGEKAWGSGHVGCSGLPKGTPQKPGRSGARGLALNCPRSTARPTPP